MGWWPGDGDARDLALANTGVIEDGVTFTPGMVGKAFTLNGGAADVVVPASTALNVSSFTMAAWVFPQDLGTARPILEYSTSTGSFGVHFWENLNSSVQVSPGSLYANIVDTSGGGHIMATNGVGGSALQLRQWNHVALTYDHATGIARMFVNGAFAAASTLGIFTPRTALPLYIGARPTSTHFLGSIDEPQVYNRALLPSEVLAIFTAGSAGNCKPTGPQPPVVSAGSGPVHFLARNPGDVERFSVRSRRRHAHHYLERQQQYRDCGVRQRKLSHHHGYVQLRRSLRAAVDRQQQPANGIQRNHCYRPEAS